MRSGKLYKVTLPGDAYVGRYVGLADDTDFLKFADVVNGKYLVNDENMISHVSYELNGCSPNGTGCKLAEAKEILDAFKADGTIHKAMIECRTMQINPAHIFRIIPMKTYYEVDK